MALALRKEAVAVATGSKVLCYSYSGNVTPLAERSCEVLGLTVYKGRLLDAGRYDGVRSTLESRRTVAGHGAQWRRIAGWKYSDFEGFDEDERRVWKERLFGAMEADEEGKFGIYELVDDEGRVATRYYPHATHHRNGRTNVLAAWHVPIDSGDYYWYVPDKQPHTTLHSSYDYEQLVLGYGDEDFSVTAFAPLDDSAYYWCTPFCVFEGSLGGKCRESKIMSLPELEAERKQLCDLLLRDDDISLRRCISVFERIKQALPDLHVGMPESAALVGRYSSKLLDSVRKYVAEKYGFSALTVADSNLLIGRRDGMLMDERGTILHEFKQPVNALCAIPEEIMDGLRQRIVRSIQMKAVHAGRRAAIRKVA